MRFLLLLLTYVIQRRLNLSLGRQLDATAARAQIWVTQKVPVLIHSGWGMLAAVVLLPTLVLSGLLCLVEDWFFGVVHLFVQLVVLFLVLGCPLLKRELDSYLQAWRDENFQAAYLHAQQLGYRVDVGLERSAQLHRRVWRDFLEQSFSRYFSVIFWFMLGGAVGALLVRLVNQAANAGQGDELRRVATMVDHWMQWIPARLLALTFALAGNFMGAVRRSVNDLIDPAGRAMTVLSQAAEGALSGDDARADTLKQSEREVRELLSLRDLLNRSVLVWFAALAALVLVGYF